MKLLRLKLLGLAASALISVNSLQAGAMVAGFNASSLAANDDGSTGSLAIGFNINFFGTTYSNLYANNNGNFTFNAPLGTFTPFNLYTSGVPIIAPFFGDVDTRGFGSDLLRYGSGTFAGRTAFGATWNGVGYFSAGVDKLNKFQSILVERSDVGTGDFDIYFNYDQVQWETGGASGGSGGLGGSSARAGYSSGVALNSYELPGSAVNGGFLDSNLTTGLIHNSNVGVDGRYLFQVRNGAVVVPPPTGVPDTASTLALMGFVLLGLIAFRRK